MPEQANPTSFADQCRGFASMIRSGAMGPDDHEMVAKKFEAAADALDQALSLIERLSGALADEGAGWSNEGLHDLRCRAASALPAERCPDWLLEFRDAP